MPEAVKQESQGTGKKPGAKRRKGNFNNIKDTRTNTAKEQPYLMPGTDEYEEYVRDLKDHDPFRPDDEFHQEMDDYNEQLPQRLLEKSQNNEDDDGKKQKARREMEKRAVHLTARAKVIREAMMTPGISDDILARMITDDNPVLHDDSVDADGYEDALGDFVEEMSM